MNHAVKSVAAAAWRHRLVLATITIVQAASSLLDATATQGAQIPLSAFGPGAITESFEGINTDVVNWIFTPFTLPSGAILSDGVIQDGLFGTTGAFGSSPIVPPHGTAFVVKNTWAGNAIDITFPADQLRAGALVAFTSNDTGLITLSAFDSSDTLIETLTVSSVNLPGWSANFVGLENPAGIRRISFESDGSVGMVLDVLTFEAVPEPSSLVLAALGLVGLAAWGWRRKR